MPQKIAIETFKQGDLDNTDIILCGIDGIDKANHLLSEAYYYKRISDDNKVSSVFGLGPSNKFFYNITAYQDNDVRCYEKGIGYAYEHNNYVYFKREIPMVYGKNAEHSQLIYGESKFYFPEDSVNVITSEIPPNIALLYYQKNSILVSRDAFELYSLEIPNNSLLATINDTISTLGLDSLEFSSYVATALENYAKGLSLKTSRLDVNKISAKHIRLEPSMPESAKKGTLLYDESSDTVKFYNGHLWRTLKWEDEEKAE